MSDPILHATYDDHYESILAPEQVAELLRTMPSLRLDVGHYNGDSLHFQYNDNDVRLQGYVRRWHGTESHITIESSTEHLPTFSRVARFVGIPIMIAFVVIMGIIAFRTNASFDQEYDLTRIIIQGGQVVLIIIAIASALGLYYYDPYVKRRWQAQQKMRTLNDTILNYIGQYEAHITP